MNFDTEFACIWCGYRYGEFTPALEREHLATCVIFRSLPVAEVRESDGKNFVAVPGHPDILVERERLA